MKLDPKTKLASLLGAVPSVAAVLENFQITTDGNEEKRLEELCAEHGIIFNKFPKGNGRPKLEGGLPGLRKLPDRINSAVLENFVSLFVMKRMARRL
jgi:hypothetical protein